MGWPRSKQALELLVDQRFVLLGRTLTPCEDRRTRWGGPLLPYPQWQPLEDRDIQTQHLCFVGLDGNVMTFDRGDSSL
jgi:hypothetical protein